MYLCNTKEKQTKKNKIMTTMNVTLATGKAGQQAIFKIQFEVSKFDEVIEKVSCITIEELMTSTLWKVI